jgi:flagellar FliL protein
MSEATSPAGETPEPAAKKRGRKLILMMSCLLLLGGGGAAAWFLVPGLPDKVKQLTGGSEQKTAAAETAPTFVELQEMAVTLPNGGHPRQMRIRVSVEVTGMAVAKGTADVLSPRVYDALLTYLRTVRDGEVDSGLGLDRLRADLFRRLDLVLGHGVVRDVLITSLVLA